MSEIVKLRELIKINNGRDYKHLGNGNIPVYGSGGLMTTVDGYIYDGESILLPRKGTLNNIMYVNGKFWTVDTMYWSTVNINKVYPKYLYCYLSLLDLSSKDSGSTLPSMTFDAYYDLPIVLLSPEAQKKIGDLYFRITDKISTNNRINSELESMAKTIYDYWFTQFDFPDENGKPYKSSGGKMVWNEELKREIPEGWKVFNVGDFCNIFTGKKDVNQSLESGIYKFYSCAPKYRYSNDMLYEGEAILISGNGSYTGRTIFINDAFDLYQRTYACVNKTDKDILLYIYYSMKRFFVPKVSGGTHGSAIPYIVYDDIAKEKIAVNYNVLSAYNKIIKPIQNKILKNERENQQLASLRDWLLPMLMNGQVGFEGE